MARKARMARTKVLFIRSHKQLDASADTGENSRLTKHEHAAPSIPKLLERVLRKPLQTSHRKTRRKNRNQENKLAGLLLKRINASNTWAGRNIHPIAVFAWLASEEPFNAEFLLENASLLTEAQLAEETDPVLNAEIDAVIQRFTEAKVTDAPSSQENPLLEVPRDFGMAMTPFKAAGHRDHDAMMIDYDNRLNAMNKILGARESAKPTKHGFDPVQVLKKHAITFQNSAAPKIPNLTIPIHPLFREDNFHGCPQHIYDVLIPGLRLCTLFLTHRATSTFWHTAMFGRREVTPIPNVMRIREDVTWTEANAQAFKKHLESLASSIHFHFSLWPSAKSEGMYVYGSMHPIKDLRRGWLPKTGEPCRKSRICLHTDFYTTAKRLSLLKSPDPTMVLRFNFFLAVNICHEFAHFLEMSSNNALRRDIYSMDGTEIVSHDAHPEPFVNDHSFNEMGVAFETKVFGGRVEPISCRIDCAYGLTTSDEPDATRPHNVRTFFTIPMDYVSMLQQQGTWDQDFTEKDWRFFHIPRDGARAVSVPYFDMTVWEDESETQISDALDQEETPFRRAYDGRIVKADRSIKTHH